MPLFYQSVKANMNTLSELQIRGGIDDNSKMIYLISQRKHML